MSQGRFREEAGMMTIVSLVTLKQGCEPEWDAVMRERLETAKTQPGWISGQLVMPLDKLDRRGVIGTWQTRADWEAWHNDPGFTTSRERLEGLQEGAGETWWHEVIFDVRAS